MRIAYDGTLTINEERQRIGLEPIELDHLEAKAREATDG